jgi:hypothetical protein
MYNGTTANTETARAAYATSSPIYLGASLSAKLSILTGGGVHPHFAQLMVLFHPRLFRKVVPGRLVFDRFL